MFSSGDWNLSLPRLQLAGLQRVLLTFAQSRQRMQSIQKQVDTIYVMSSSVQWKMRNMITLGLKVTDNINQVAKIVPFHLQCSKV
jgi:hypothetical protein